MAKLVTVCLVIVGLINFLPVIGLLGLSNLESAYQIKIHSGDLLILMQHRALLFGLLGGFILHSTFFPSYQGAAIVLAGISMVGFAVLFHTVGSNNQAMTKVLYADYVGILFLVIAIVLKYGFKGT